MRSFALPVFALGLAACVSLSATAALAQSAATYTGQIKSPDGQDIGTISVTPGPDGVVLRVEAHGLVPGAHVEVERHGEAHGFVEPSLWAAQARVLRTHGMEN